METSQEKKRAGFSKRAPQSGSAEIPQKVGSRVSRTPLHFSGEVDERPPALHQTPWQNDTPLRRLDLLIKSPRAMLFTPYYFVAVRYERLPNRYILVGSRKATWQGLDRIIPTAFSACNFSRTMNPTADTPSGSESTAPTDPSSLWPPSEIARKDV